MIYWNLDIEYDIESKIWSGSYFDLMNSSRTKLNEVIFIALLALRQIILSPSKG